MQGIIPVDSEYRPSMIVVPDLGEFMEKKRAQDALDRTAGMAAESRVGREGVFVIWDHRSGGRGFFLTMGRKWCAERGMLL